MEQPRAQHEEMYYSGFVNTFCPGFISATTSPLLTYARDVNVHFANKKCQELIVEARQLMKRELHNTKRVGSSSKTGSNKNVEEQKETSSEVKDQQDAKVGAVHIFHSKLFTHLFCPLFRK